MTNNLQRGSAGLTGRTTCRQAWVALWCAGLLALGAIPAMAQPVNDNFANAMVIAITNNVIIGGNVAATQEPSEPSHGRPEFTTTNSIWYRWTSTNTGPVTFRNSGSFPNMIFAIYTGAAVDSLTLVTNNVRTNTVNGNIAYTFASQVTFNVSSNTQYMIAADGTNGSVGRVVLSWAWGNGGSPPVGAAGAFSFTSFENFVTENESAQAPLQNPVFTPTLNGRSVRGAVFTVTRTGGSTGRVSVRYRTVDTSRNSCGTEDTFDGLSGCDYTAVSGILVFDEFQMTRSFVVPVRSDFRPSGNKSVAVQLESPLPDPDEETVNPGKVAPVLTSTPFALVTIREVNQGQKLTFGTGTNTLIQGTNIVIERATYAVDEGAGSVDVDILNVGFTAGTVWVSWTGVNGKGAYAPLPGSDYADPTGSAYPVPPFTDGTTGLPNPPDFSPTNRMLVTFALNEGRRSVSIPILNDGIPEFNEDILIFLDRPGIADPPIGANRSARVTILYDDQPAGALDREWNPDGVSTTTPRLNPAPGANNIVRAVAVQPDQRTVIVGDFTAYNSFPRNRIARINTDGSNDASFNPGTGADDFIVSVAVYPAAGGANDGKIVVGGGFTSMNNIQRNGIARLNTDGSLDTLFNPGSGADGVVRSVAIQGDGKVVIGGEFTQFNGFQRRGVARLNADGSLDTTFNPGAGTDGPIWAVAVTDTPTRKIYIGGEFLDYNGAYRGNVARLNENGSLDLTFDPGGGTDGPVYALAPQADGRLLVGGFFSIVDFSDRRGIARFLSTGPLDLSFDPGSGANDAVYSITLQGDGKSLVGGVFTSFNGTRRVGLTRLFVDGTVDTSFLDTGYNQFAGLINDFSFEAPNYVNSVALQADGAVLIGGSFTQAGGNFANEINNKPPTAAISGNSFNVWTRSDKRVRFNVARLIGGYTPGPGNVGFVLDQNSVDENAGTLSVPLQRYDGRLGTVGGVAVTDDNLAIGGTDFSSGSSPVTWPQESVGPISVGFVGERIFTVPITEDVFIEGDELFGLRLTNAFGSINLSGEFIPLGGALARRGAKGTITDNDFEHGVFAFGSPTFFTNENSTSMRVIVSRTNGSSGLVSVRYFTRDGTATAGSDYTAASGTLTFGQGVTSQTISIPLINDFLVEADEYFTVTLTNATGGAIIFGGQPTSTVTATNVIIDNDLSSGKANFVSSASYKTNEAAVLAQISLYRLGGSVGPLTVSVAAASGTATAGIDFTGVTNTVTWVNGDVAPKTILVPLIDDSSVEGNETVSLRIFNPSIAGAIGAVSNAVLTILDDDFFGTLSFSQPNYDADERGTNVTITVVRTGGLGDTVSIDYAVANGPTATNLVDFLTTSGTLSFGPGVMATNFDVIIVNNTNVAPGGEVQATLNLSNFRTNGIIQTAGMVATSALRILDDESVGDPAGSLDTTFSPLAGGTNAIYALAFQQTNGVPDGRILVAGEFRTLNRTLRNRVGRLNADGTLDRTFNPLGGPNNVVRSMAVQPDGRIVIGGFFTSVHATNRSRIARLLADGSVDGFFNPGAGADNPVYAVALHPDGRIVVGGSFTTMNGISRAGIALLEPNGTVSTTFVPGTGADGAVYGVAVQPDGKILVGGDFLNFNGANHPRLVRLNLDGSVDTSFDAGTGPDGTVRAITLQPNGKLLVGGSFTHVNGTTRGRLARLDVNGSVDATFLVSVDGANADVNAIALQFDSKIIVAGEFTTFNGVTRTRITRLFRNGKTDPTINFGGGANDAVNSVVIQADRKLLLGGRFTQYDYQQRYFLARIHGGSIAGGGTLEFSTPYYEVNENAGQALITVQRRGGTTGDVSVDYQSLAGTATAGADYTNVLGTLNFPESETLQTFTVPIVNDFVGEPNETVSLILSNAVGAVLGAVPNATLTILNDDSGVGFNSASYTVNEGVAGGAVVITVVRTGATNGTATVNYATTGGTALPGQDYTSQSGVVTFAPGESVHTFNVAVTDDTLIEPSETFAVVLSNLSGSAALNIDSTTVTIVDNDFRAGSLTFSATGYSVAESGGTLTVTVLRTNGTTGVLSVDYAIVDGTAQGGNDYVAQAGSLSFAEGQTNQTIIITILDDVLVEGDENFSVRLFNPGSGTTISGPTNVFVTIVDEEFGPGSLDRTFDPGLGANDIVRSVAARPDGRLMVGGAFTTFGTGTNRYVTRLLADGSNDVTFAPAGGPNGLVTAVAATADGRSVFSGAFTRVDGVLFNQVARARTNGPVDLNFDHDAGFNGSVNAISLQTDGRIVVGGAFNLPTRGVVRLRLDGTVDTAFTPGAGVNGQVHCVFVQGDGRVLVGGTFTTVDGEARSRVARFHPDGSLDASFVATAISNGTVYAITVQTNGKVVVAGDFATTAGTNAVRIARLNADGSLDSAFNVGRGADGVVFALGLNSFNQVFVGGNFTSINGTNRSRFARLHSDGSLDAGFDPGPGANAAVFTLAVLPSDDLIIGGDFTTVSGAVRNRVARILGGGLAFSPVASAAASGGQFLLSFSTQAGRTYRLETSSNLVDWILVTTKTATGASLQWTQPIAGTAGGKFYRLRQMTP